MAKVFQNHLPFQYISKRHNCQPVAFASCWNFSEFFRSVPLSYMVVDEKGKIELPRDYCNWYGNDEFALWLKEFVEEGTMEFISEDGDKWGYWFDGKGNVHALRYPERLPEKQELYNS